jgi:methylenetetrahydrofolate reductase (NADPH)
MKQKVEFGADFLITQLFFDNHFYFDLVSRARNAGISVPIVPGLMPVPSRRSLGVMTSMSGATVPEALQQAIDEAADDESIRALGVRHCIEQCAELLEAGVPGLHFYTFNRARAPIEILSALRGAQLIAS